MKGCSKEDKRRVMLGFQKQLGRKKFNAFMRTRAFEHTTSASAARKSAMKRLHSTRAKSTVYHVMFAALGYAKTVCKSRGLAMEEECQ